VDTGDEAARGACGECGQEFGGVDFDAVDGCARPRRPPRRDRPQRAAVGTKSYGMLIQVVQRLPRECVPSGDIAETEMRCLPDSKSSGGLASVIPFLAPMGFVGSGMGNSMTGFLAPAEMS